MTDRPWYPWYPQDWRGEDRLKLCSLAARGLWRELLDAMHFAEPRGHLVVQGRAHTEAEIATLVGAKASEVHRLLAELEAHRVFSRTDDGIIYSRRMVRDEQKHRRNSTNGGKGGNPKLIGSDKPSDKPSDNRQTRSWSDKPSDKAHAGTRDRVPESRDQKPDPEARRDTHTASARIASGPHRNHASCGRPCVPDFVHVELRTKLGGHEDEADRALRAWYGLVMAHWAGNPIGVDDPKFWRSRFEEWQDGAGGRARKPTLDEQNAAAWAEVDRQAQR